MHCTISKDLEVNAPANDVWATYRLLRMPKFFTQNLSHLVRKSETLEGDGKVGTIVKLSLAPGICEFDTIIERYTKFDMEMRKLEAETIEGGYLDMGFTSYHYRAQVIETSANSCVVRLSVEYEVNEGVDLNCSLNGLQFLVKTAEAISSYTIKNKKA